jgi:tyrosyl-DNA phosphodiesterase 2
MKKLNLSDIKQRINSPLESEKVKVIKPSGITGMDDCKIFQVPSYKYNQENLEWEKLNQEKINVNVDHDFQGKISFLSYNIWFEEHNWKNRTTAILELLQQNNSDVICLQEVISEFIVLLCESTFIQNNYYISGNFDSGYDVLMLTKFPCCFYISFFISLMERKLLFCTFTYKDRDFCVSTAHFESLKNSSKVRKEQLDLSFKILNENQTKNSFICLMGDFNFDNNEEEKNIDESFLDSWLYYKKNLRNIKNTLGDNDGYTMCVDPYPPWRPDKLFYKGDIKLTKFEIIGREEIEVNSYENLKPVLTPSDHYGIFVQFEL